MNESLLVNAFMKLRMLPKHSSGEESAFFKATASAMPQNFAAVESNLPPQFVPG
jgi:hypothetical protein